MGTSEHAVAYTAADSVVGIAQKIQSRMPEMSGAMVKIARFLVEKPQAPLTLSIKELAAETGTSAATVTRFCRIIGYSGYAPFRVGVAADSGRSDAREAWKTDIGRAFGPDDSPRDVLSSLLNAHTRSLVETASTIDLTVLKAVARKIALAAHVDIYGIGGSAIMAMELQNRLYRIGITAYYWTEVHAGLASASLRNRDSVAIGISNTGRTEETIEMLRQAGQAGAYTVALTSNPHSPLVESAEVHLVTSAYERFLQPDDLSAKHVQLLAIDLLYLLVAQENFARTTATLSASAVAVAPHRRPTRSQSAAERIAQITPHSVERKRTSLA
ncbi:MurR/RpiR family transcriptional regulator [Psychromicrobium xiongbiense]|uniref:MurR/RpiR family transcriptional regulator n=1 Tax=Psychromicrobium xiongbiense TaxID=3051184 RepID=UPI0025525BBA|nr:MurR/RpiR family transcriptional regulator [Psychromicrobium sp. YIM S02556]